MRTKDSEVHGSRAEQARTEAASKFADLCGANEERNGLLGQLHGEEMNRNVRTRERERERARK